MKENLAVSKPRGEEQLSEDLVREELSRILESSLFVRSDRLGRFLRFTVETTLAGEADTLKEYLIGTEAYNRDSSYRPGEDSIVRSEARRLHSKLKEYYESVGKDDSVFIYYRPGSYVPAFRLRTSRDNDRVATDRPLGELFTEGLVAQALAVPSAAGKLNVQIVFEGTVRVLRPGSASSTPTGFRSGQSILKRDQIRKVFSMSLRESDQRRSPER
jgi:hypothetical protein